MPTSRMSDSIIITLVAKLFLLHILIQVLGKIVTKMLCTKCESPRECLSQSFPKPSL